MAGGNAAKKLSITKSSLSMRWMLSTAFRICQMKCKTTAKEYSSGQRKPDHRMSIPCAFGANSTFDPGTACWSGGVRESDNGELEGAVHHRGPFFVVSLTFGLGQLRGQRPAAAAFV